jgi:hypothetical protein
VLHDRLPPDVDNERHGRPDRGDLRQVLLGADAETPHPAPSLAGAVNTRPISGSFDVVVRIVK